MKIALVGYGRMGRTVHDVALHHGHEVVSVTDPFSSGDAITDIELNAQSLRKADVVIDFSSPKTAVENIRFYIDNCIRAVIGTTGWYDKVPALKDECEAKGGSVMWSGNFSIGVAVMLKAASYLSFLMNGFSEYDVSIHEVHHREKADSPSGTALMLAERVLDGTDRKTELLIGNSEGKIKPGQLQVTSERNGYVPGIHTLTFDSPADTLTLTHSARNREGFALGAVRAAEWLIGKEGFFSMDDFLHDSLGRYLND